MLFTRNRYTLKDVQRPRYYPVRSAIQPILGEAGGVDDGPHILPAIVAAFDAVDPTRAKALAIADKVAAE